MNKLLSIDPAVLRRLQELPKSERVECLLALCELAETFGQPHVHSGLGIRKLGNKLFECRGSRALRFIFQDRPPVNRDLSSKHANFPSALGFSGETWASRGLRYFVISDASAADVKALARLLESPPQP